MIHVYYGSCDNHYNYLLVNGHAMSDDYDVFYYENSLVSFKNCKELIKLLIGNNLLSNCKTCEIIS